MSAMLQFSITPGSINSPSPATALASSVRFARLIRSNHIDGQPLPARAGVLIQYAEWFAEPEQNNGTWVADVLWLTIDLDPQWISMHWN
jgi:hypothetical protein